MMYSAWQRFVVNRFVAPVVSKAKDSKRFNQVDRELLHALERIFITPPPQTDDPEDEFDYIAIRMLLMLVLFVTILKFVMILFLGSAASGLFSPLYGMLVATFFYALFYMLYFEMNETGVVTMFIATVSLLIGMWSSF